MLVSPIAKDFSASMSKHIVASCRADALASLEGASSQRRACVREGVARARRYAQACRPQPFLATSGGQIRSPPKAPLSTMSGGELKVGPTGDGAVNAGASAELVAHTGVVFLDRANDGRWFVTHLISRERAVVQGEGPWRLEYDDEGFGFLLHANIVDRIIFVEDLLTYCV